jgi:anti-sigma regulatory factor (Ser/Thr protein kinase)
VQGNEVEQLVLIVSELLANAVDHGQASPAMTERELEADARMRLVLSVGSHEWRLSVTDEGGGDAARLRQAIQSARLPDLEDERGRGFYLMRQMVDAMEVDTSADGRGLTFRVVRRHAGR